MSLWTEFKSNEDSNAPGNRRGRCAAFSRNDKLGFVGIAKGFPLGGSCLRSRLMRGQVWNGFPFIATSSGPSGHLPLKGKAFEGALQTYKPQSIKTK